MTRIGIPSAAAIPPGTFAQGLISTAVKTAPYTAAPKDYVLTDATAGSINHPLPTAPPDLTRIGYKMVATSGSNVVTFTCGGSDHLNTATGPTVGTLTLPNQAAILQYAASTAIWTVQSSDLPLSQLDLRLVRVAQNYTDGQAGGLPVFRAIPSSHPTAPAQFLVSGTSFTGNSQTWFDTQISIGFRNEGAIASVMDVFEQDYWSNSNFDGTWHHQVERHMIFEPPGLAQRRVITWVGRYDTGGVELGFTADRTDWANVAGTTLLKLDAAGLYLSSAQTARLGVNVNAAPYLGYNMRWNTSSLRFEHDQTGAMSGLGFDSDGSVSFYGNTSQTAATASTTRFKFTPAGLLTCNPGAASLASLTFFSTTYGIGMDAADLCIFGDSAAGVSIRSGGVAGTKVAWFKSSGKIGFNTGTTAPRAQLDVWAGTGNVTLMLLGNGTQAIQEWQNNVGTVLRSITAAGLMKWDAAASVQTTVGAAGAASALPATPSKYLKVVGDDGVTYVVPAYLAA